jgi:protein SCO1/2
MDQPMPVEPKAKAHHAPTASKTKAGAKGSPILWLLGGALLLLALLGAFWLETTPQGSGGVASGSGVAAIGGPFAMVDQDGKPVDQSVLNGKWTAVFFGYTYCPDVCPATLQALGGAYRKLGDRGRNFQVLFVSVDPARDHPAQMKAYIDAQALPMRTLGLTGTPDQLAIMAKAYRATYAKVGEGPGYTMDHTAVIYLMDPAGRFAAPLTHDMAPDKIAGEIRAAQGSR